MTFIDRDWPHGQHLEAASVREGAIILAALAWIEMELLKIHAKLDTLTRLEKHMAGELDKLEADVAAEAGVIDSAVALLQGLKAALDAAIASGDMSRVAAVNASIEEKTAALAAAVAANSPPVTP